MDVRGRKPRKRATMKPSRMQSLLQLYLTLQADFHSLYSEQPRFATIAEAARRKPSALHGSGLFAAGSPLEKGAVAAFYPAHALGDTKRRYENSEGDATDFGGTDHKPYRVALPPSPGLVAWGADDLWIDVDPSAKNAACQAFELDGYGHMRRYRRG